MIGPLIFEPFFRTQIWGGRRLERILGKSLPAVGNFGESWEVSAHPLHLSRVRCGGPSQMDLAELWDRFGEMIWGTTEETPDGFPWLAKFLDCEDFLSVQVHPDHELAARFCPGERGKTEVWVILAAEPTAKIFVGLRPEVRSPRDLFSALQHKQPDAYLVQFTPHPQDVFFIPPGTVHSAGGGVLIAEIQTASDATFRLYDWGRRDAAGRPRPLHLEASLEAIAWQGGRKRGKIEPVPIAVASGVTAETLADVPEFTVSRWMLHPGAKFSGEISGPVLCMTLAGEWRLEVPGHPEMTFRTGETVLIPACCRSFTCYGESQQPAMILVCEPPGTAIAKV